MTTLDSDGIIGLKFRNHNAFVNPHYQPFRFEFEKNKQWFYLYCNKNGINMYAWGQSREISWPTPFTPPSS